MTRNIAIIHPSILYTATLAVNVAVSCGCENYFTSSLYPQGNEKVYINGKQTNTNKDMTKANYVHRACRAKQFHRIMRRGQ